MKWWMRSVGGLYLFMFLMAAVLRVPIRVLGPPGVLDRAAAGEPTARLLVDTWATLGLEFVAIGVALLIASRIAERAQPLVWTILAIELVRGIGTDVYMIARGYAVIEHAVWIAVHAVIIGSGVLLLRKESSAAGVPALRAAHE